MQKDKIKHPCPKCGGPMKKTIGAQSRRKYWVCIDNGERCHKAPVPASLAAHPW